MALVYKIRHVATGDFKSPSGQYCLRNKNGMVYTSRKRAESILKMRYYQEGWEVVPFRLTEISWKEVEDEERKIQEE
jgi:hypothetical protein